MTNLNNYNNDSPKTLKPICDGISITIDIPEHYREQLENNIESIKRYAKKYGYAIARKISLNKEKLNAYSDKTGQSDVIIQCSPYNRHKNFLYIHFNPSKILMNELKNLVDELFPFDYGYSYLISTGIVTRCDIAVDIKYVEINSLLFRYPQKRINCIYTSSGRTEYIGSLLSNNYFCIYDKRTEIKKKNKKKVFLLKDKVPEYPVTRIELRLKLSMTIEEISKITNPFRKLKIISYQNLDFPSDSDKLFLKVARLEGTQAAMLTMTDKNTRAAYAKKLSKGCASWWDSEVTWKDTQEMINNIRVPKQANKQPI